MCVQTVRLGFTLAFPLALVSHPAASQTAYNLSGSAASLERVATTRASITLDALRPPPVSADERARVLATLPSSGELEPDHREAAKLAAVGRVLAFHGRLGVYVLKVIDVHPAAIGLHGRAVLLISRPALRLLSAAELQAIVAHEVGHELVWDAFARARARGDSRELRQLELNCDAIAVLTLLRLGLDPQAVVDGLRKLTHFNEELGATANSDEYPSLDQRSELVAALSRERRGARPRRRLRRRLSRGRSVLPAVTLALIIAVPARSAGQTSGSPIAVPFERAPAPYVVIRVPVAGATCEPLIFDTGTTTTVLAPALAARAGLSMESATRAESLDGPVQGVLGEVRGIGFPSVSVGASRTAIAADVVGLRGFGRSIAGLYGHNWLMGTDYLIDYRARLFVIGAAGTILPSAGGDRTPLTWLAGRPAVDGVVRGRMGGAFSARLVLDSGADHVTLFGRAAERMALAADRDGTLRVDSRFGSREVAAATAIVDVSGHSHSVTVALRSEVKDREEDGLLPTSLYRSVLIATDERVVVFEPSMPPPTDLKRTTTCDE